MPRRTYVKHKALGGRRRAAMRLAAEAKRDALLITSVADVGYLSGFTGDDSWLLLGKGWTCLITDGRFVEQAEAECPGVEVFARTKSLSVSAAQVLSGRGVRWLGYQKAHVSVAVRDTLADSVGAGRIRPVADLIARLRAVKDAEELRAIRKAVRIADRAFTEITARGAKGLVGKTERHIAAELEYRMRLAGADGPAFPPIVAVGSNGSKCHYRPADRRLRSGQALLVDWGASVGGYCSDLTRTLFFCTIPPKLAEVYDVVRRAQAAGIAACRPGVKCRTADLAARGVIESAGYGKQFVHGLGHGIGRQVHEGPRLARNSDDRFRTGMVATIEPGIYLPGLGGVRIEDDIEITPGGPKRLSRLSRALQRMVLR